MEHKKYYVYIALCGDQSLYTGYSTDLDRRLKEHNSGKKGAKYTRAHLPVELAYSEEFGSASEAKVREAEIKKMTREGKLRLINEN